MEHIAYNSRLEYHKSKFGAVKQGEEIIFRLVMPRHFQVSSMYLLIFRDCGHCRRIGFEWERMEGEHEEWWRLSYKADEKGLFFYRFEYDTPYGRHNITKTNGCLGALSDRGDNWQLTVYDKNFKTPDAFKGGIIYQIFPDRFCRSGKVKKNVPADRIMQDDIYAMPKWAPDEQGIIHNNDFFGGDLKGIEEKLDYLVSLGVSCIYLNPIFMAQSNHRYDTGDYEKIDPLLGTESDFKSLCRKAKQKNIRIILDGVFSHTGVDSKYFNMYSTYDSVGAYQSQSSEYYHWYKFRHWPNDYVSWWGINILPEVNEENESYLEYISGENGIVRKWLRAGASGWRLDVADELPDIFLDRIREAAKAEKSDAYILGEVWEDASNKTSYSFRRRYLQGDQLDGVMNYPFYEAICRFVRTGETDGFSETILNVLENYPKPCVDVLMNHIGTHDTARIVNVLAGEDYKGKDRKWQSEHPLQKQQLRRGKKLLKIAAALQFSLPGIPSIYYGDEAGLQGYADPFNRRFFPWGEEDEELIEYYRLLGKTRKTFDCFKDGDFEMVSDVCGCIAYMRHGKNDSLITVANRNSHEIAYYLPTGWECDNVVFGGEKSNDHIIIPAETACMAVCVKSIPDIDHGCAYLAGFDATD